MYDRLCKPIISRSFFLFGARGTGKTTLIRELLSTCKVLEIDLLDPELFESLSLNPSQLKNLVLGARNAEWIFIDEVQKLPELLNIVQILTTSKEAKQIKFALSGSSARKLKTAGANLLAGRALNNDLFPFTSWELENSGFDIVSQLNWGGLPAVVTAESDLARSEFLKTYVRNYLKEEVWDSRLVKDLTPFRKFVEVAAQTSGQILNYSNISRQTGIDDKTVKKYFEILSETFMGFFLEAFDESVRTQQLKSPKFFIFDLGVKRAMEGLLTVPLTPKTFAFGRSFESHVIGEVFRLNSYFRRDFKLFYLKDKSDLEIDLIIKRPGSKTICIAIKSSDRIDEMDNAVLRHMYQSFGDAEFQIWSLDRYAKKFDRTTACHWVDGIRHIFAQ